MVTSDFVTIQEVPHKVWKLSDASLIFLGGNFWLRTLVWSPFPVSASPLWASNTSRSTRESSCLCSIHPEMRPPDLQSHRQWDPFLNYQGRPEKQSQSLLSALPHPSLKGWARDRICFPLEEKAWVQNEREMRGKIGKNNNIFKNTHSNADVPIRFFYYWWSVVERKQHWPLGRATLGLKNREGGNVLCACGSSFRAARSDARGFCFSFSPLLVTAHPEDDTVAAFRAGG